MKAPAIKCRVCRDRGRFIRRVEESCTYCGEEGRRPSMTHAEKTTEALAGITREVKKIIEERDRYRLALQQIVTVLEVSGSEQGLRHIAQKALGV